MQSDTPKKETVWYTGELEHEGFPLMLRFPEKPDFDSLQDRYPRLLTIEHHFAQVKSNGLPESPYNTSLFEFDQHILGMLGDSGFPVLVETFAGKRTYYIYITPELDAVGAIDQLRVLYPEHKIESEVRKGSGWRVIRQYSEDYSFYKKKGDPVGTDNARAAPRRV